MEPNVIELTNLTKKYGSYTAVDSLNLTIRKGEIFGLLGPNGAGKSTTILMMLGLTDPTSGTVSVCGINSTSHPMEVKRKVGYLPEDVGFYDDRTGFENLIYTARLNRISLEDARARAQKLLVRVGLGHETSKKTGKYSRGMRQRLGLADVLIKDPEIIILDEPTSGIDPNGVREFMDLIVQLSKEEGITVLFSSHHLHQVQQVCDRVGLFVGGKLLAEGDIFTLSEQVFAGEPLLVEVGYVPESKDVSKVQDALRIIDGVIEVWQENDLFRICCSKDITPVIAKTVIDAGIPLVSLNKKEYGLDDIYNRYFEGGNNE